MKPSGNPFGGLDDSFRSVPTVNPIHPTVTNPNPYDGLNKMIKQMPEYPHKVSLDKSKDADVTLTPSLFGQDNSQINPEVEDSREGKRVLEQPPRSAAEFAGYLKNKDRSASTPPPSSEDDADDTTKTGETVINKLVKTKVIGQTPEGEAQSNTLRSSITDSPFVTPNSRATYSTEKRTHPSTGFHTVGSINTSRLETSNWSIRYS